MAAVSEYEGGSLQLMGGFVGKLKEVGPQMDDPPERLDTNAIVQDPSVCPSGLFFTDTDQQRIANAAETEPAFHDAVQDETETFPPPLDGEN